MSMPSKNDSFLRRRLERSTAAACSTTPTGPGCGAEAAAVLRSLEAQAPPRERLIRVAEHRIVLARVDPDRPVLVLAHAAHVQLQRLPRPEPLRDLLGEHRRVARPCRTPPASSAPRPMVAVAVALVALESRDDHERPLGADDADDVAEDVVACPTSRAPRRGAWRSRSRRPCRSTAGRRRSTGPRAAVPRCGSARAHRTAPGRSRCRPTRRGSASAATPARPRRGSASPARRRARRRGARSCASTLAVVRSFSSFCQAPAAP